MKVITKVKILLSGEEAKVLSKLLEDLFKGNYPTLKEKELIKSILNELISKSP